MKCSRIWWKTKSKLDFWEEQDWGQTPAVSAGERTEWRETKGSSGKQGFSFFFFLCMSEPAGLPARGEKKTWTAIFDRSQVDKRPRTFLFPTTLFLTLLSSIVWHWLGPEKKQKTKNITKHTQKTQPLLQDAWARQSLQGRGEPGQSARVLLRAHSKEFGVCEEALYRGRKKRRLKSDLSRSVKGRDLFFPLSFPFSMSCWRGIWDAVSKGRLEELYFKIISCLKILEAFIAALLKALFKWSIRSTQTLGCCPV